MQTNVYNARATRVSKNTITHVGGGGSITACGGRPSHSGFPGARRRPGACSTTIRRARGVLRGGADLRATWSGIILFSFPHHYNILLVQIVGY